LKVDKKRAYSRFHLLYMKHKFNPSHDWNATCLVGTYKTKGSMRVKEVDPAVWGQNHLNLKSFSFWFAAPI